MATHDITIRFTCDKDEYSVSPVLDGGSRVFRFIKHTGKGGAYEVRQGDSGPKCECPGFTYRGACRHLDMLEAFGCLGTSAEAQPVGAVGDDCPF
jgi:hypothetical protein